MDRTRSTRMLSASGVFAAIALLVATAPVDAQVTFTDVAVEAGIADLHWHGIPPEEVVQADREMLYMSAGGAAADFDRDGWVDLFVTRLDAPNLLYRNLQDGTFTDEAAARGVDFNGYSTGAAVADIDNDGDLDLYLLTTYPTLRNFLYVNDGNGNFTEEAVARGVDMEVPNMTHHCTSATFGDYDGDGLLDLAVVAWQWEKEKKRLFRNTGNGYFEDATVRPLADTEMA